MEDKFLKPDIKVKVKDADLKHVAGKIETDEGLEDFPENGEIKQLGPEKSESRVSRVLGALKNVGTKDFWFKERQLISDNESDGKAMKLGKNMLRAGGLLGKSVFDMAGNVTGAKVVFDLPLWALQANEVRQNKNEMKAFLKGKNSFAEKNSKIREMLDRATMAKKLTPKELEDFQAALAKISESEGLDHGEKYDALIDNYLQAKTSGMQVVRQAVNAAFVASGGVTLNLAYRVVGAQATRGVSMLGLKALETLYEAKKESVRSEFGGEKRETSEIFKKKFIDGARNTFSLGMSSEKKDRTGLQKFADTTKALGTIGTFLGIGNAALSEINHGSASEHVVTALEKLKDKGFDQVGENFVNNAMKMWNFYGHPADSFQKAKEGVGGIISRFFGESSQKESLGGLQDGVNYQSDATRMDMDGRQLPQEASFGRATSILQAGESRSEGGMTLAELKAPARGVMEGYTNPQSVVEMSPAELAARSAAGTIASLPGEAQSLVRGAARGAYDAMSDLAGPPMSKMPLEGQLGMSPHDLDGHQIPEDASFGRAVVAGSAARGIMEGYDSKSYVEATPVEQAAMAAGAKFGELHGKAQGLAGSAAQKVYESISELAKPPMSEMASGPSGMSYRNYTEELAAKAAEKIVGAHNEAINVAGEVKDRAAEFLGLKPKDQEFTFDETVVTADRPRMGVHHPQYDSVRNQLRGGVPKGMENDEKSDVDDFLKRSRESQDRLRAAMAKPLEPIGAKQASLSEGGVKEKVSAEVARATAKIDEALATPVKPIGLGKALAEAQRGVPSTTEGQTNEDSSKELVDAYRKSEARLKGAMAQPQERIGGTRGSSAAQELTSKGEDSDARKAVKAAWKKAGGDKIDEVINTPNRSTVLQRALVAGQEKADAAALAQTQEEAPRVISSNGKSALRMKLDAIDKAGRELSGPDSEDRLRATKEVTEMKRILGSAKNSNLDSETPFERAAASEKKMLVNDLSKLGLSLKNDESLIFQPTKEIQKQLVNSGVDYGLARQAYQIGALEHEAAALPVGSARDRVLSLKRSLQESLDKMLKESASGSEKSTVKKLISAIAKDPRKF